MSFLLDADWIIQLLAGDATAVTVLQRLQGRRIATCWFAIAEVYEGAFGTPNPQVALMNARQIIGAYTILNFNDEVAERFAQERAYLSRRGLLIPDMDLLIAATALTYDLTLLTFNQRHFARIPDLRIYSPASS